MFIAAFAVAGAVSIRLKRGRYSIETPARRAKRDMAIRGIVHRFGRAIISSSGALRRFEADPTMLPRPAAAPLPQPDPAIAAVVASPAVAALIGAPSHERDAADAWVEVRSIGSRKYLNVYWRGDLMHGDTTVTGWSDAEKEGGRIVRQEHRIAGDRIIDLPRMKEATVAVVAALKAAGLTPSSFTEVRRIKTGSLGGGESFEGLIATVGLIPVPARAPAFAR